MSQLEIGIEDLSFNPFRKLDEQWALVAAGDEKDYDGLTASWGGFGFVWGRNVVTTYIRPQRYTKTFMDSHDYFSLSFFPESYREALLMCGRVSGRDMKDKVGQAGFTVEFIDDVPTFKEAGLTLVCKKLYTAPLLEDCFVDRGICDEMYPEKDFSLIFIGEVTTVLKNEETPDIAAIKKEEMDPSSHAYSQASA